MTFYGATPEDAQFLHRAFARFSATLKKDIEVETAFQ